MSFTNLEFFILFPLLLTGFWLIGNHRARKLYLLAWNCYLYAWWDYRFLGLLLMQTSVDYFLTRKMDATVDTFQRKIFLLISLGMNLGLLGLFKYHNFFLDSIGWLMGHDLRLISLIVPLGISFYTFRAISYVVDVYQRRMPAADAYLDYALYMTFFPVMLAGPIVRAKEFLPQLTQPHTFDSRFISRGFWLLSLGLFQKIFVADRLSLFVGPVFANAPAYSTATCWLAVLAYTLQIFCDFQGYSNMAIGAAHMLGYQVPRNFNWPYLARNISDFWRRWHITLSTWIRDYLYIPLGGNRHGEVKTILNLLVAMTLCGLWHGAGWTFVLWGFFHGLALVIRRIWKRIFLKDMPSLPAWGLTQFTVIICWVVFRAESLPQAGAVLSRLFVPTAGVNWPQPFICSVLAGAVLMHVLQLLRKQKELVPQNAWYMPAVAFGMLWLVVVFPPKEFAPFVYAAF